MYLELAVLFVSAQLLFYLVAGGGNNNKSKKGKLDVVKDFSPPTKEDVAVPQGGSRKEIRYEGRLYDVTEFLPRHPGGDIINYYVNNVEDATQAIQQFHHRSKDKVGLILKSFWSRPVVSREEGGEQQEEPKVLESRRYYERLTADFEKLQEELEEEGYFQPSKLHVLYRFVEATILQTTALYLVANSSSNNWVLAGGVLLLGISGGRIGWLMHEGGHFSLTGKPDLDRLLQEFSFGFGIGLSASFWRRQHNRHHAMPQRLKHDVDLNTAPFFATNLRVLETTKTESNFFLRHQALFFVPLGTSLTVFNWALNLHPRYAWRKGRFRELFFIATHWALAFYVGLWGTMLARAVGGVIMFLNFSLSHSHMPVTEEPRHWVEYSLSHTINIEPSWWVDWWMGYLNYQIEHHLFPTMPQFRQRKIRARVRALAEKHGLPYTCVSYGTAVMKTYRNLINISQKLSQES